MGMYKQYFMVRFNWPRPPFILGELLRPLCLAFKCTLPGRLGFQAVELKNYFFPFNRSARFAKGRWARPGP
jgi:hypothetical protein